MISSSGVFYGDLKDSPFKVNINGYTFYFSQKCKLDRFLNDIKVKVEWLNDSLSKRFKMPFDVFDLALFNLYSKVETRGFTYSYDGQYFDSPPTIKVYVVNQNKQSECELLGVNDD